MTSRFLHIAALLFLVGIFLSFSAQAQRNLGVNDVTIEIIDDRGRVFKQYPIRSRPNAFRAYLEAVKNKNYSVRVNNRSRSRIGLVIAVDGRNIISGKRSDLKPNERMYVLGARQSATYKGWRTGRNKVNRFFFSDAGDSYASAWGDESALGVIAVAAFKEFKREITQKSNRSQRSAPSPAQSDQAGTGFGEEEESNSRTVEFTPERKAFARYFVKYEWRDGLCEREVIDCAPPPPPPLSKLTIDDVNLQVVDDYGQRFNQYPVRSKKRNTYRAYLEAETDLNYGLKVRNRSNQRIGLVIAVDGRNIISGKRSNLKSNERMYILGPGEQAVYKGWRTGKNKINRFYFTDEGASYAAAWNDRSATGVIAIATFQEQPTYQTSRKSSSKSSARASRSQEAGTGFGDEEHSASRRVEFTPQNKSFAKYFMKYEWRRSLCEKGVIKCQRESKNRLWDDDDDGFAKPPPRN